MRLFYAIALIGSLLVLLVLVRSLHPLVKSALEPAAPIVSPPISLPAALPAKKPRAPARTQTPPPASTSSGSASMPPNLPPQNAPPVPTPQPNPIPQSQTPAPTPTSTPIGPGPSSTMPTAPSNPPSPVPLAQLGACGSCIGGPPGIDAVQAFESQVGRSADYVLVWGWAQTPHDFEYSFQYLSQLWPSSYMLEWTVPMIMDGTTFADVTAGTYDSSYLSAAQTIAARDPHARIRIGQEMNGNWEPWSIGGPAGSAEEYVAAYRHIVALFRSVSPDFTFVWNPSLGSWGGIDPAPSYPGDDVVDYISMDVYEDKNYLSGSPDARWNDILTRDGRGLDWLASFAAAHGKPIGIDEWGTNYDDGSFIAHMHDWMAAHHVAYEMYWDSDAAFSGSFASHPSNGTLFATLFGK